MNGEAAERANYQLGRNSLGQGLVQWTRWVGGQGQSRGGNCFEDTKAEELIDVEDAVLPHSQNQLASTGCATLVGSDEMQTMVFMVRSVQLPQ